MGAQLSTTSEGLWLTAALSGVTRLPAALRVRPVGDAESMLASHPGLPILEEAGYARDAHWIPTCRNGFLPWAAATLTSPSE